jgi:hypothetical protein
MLVRGKCHMIIFSLAERVGEGEGECECSFVAISICGSLSPRHGAS